MKNQESELNSFEQKIADRYAVSSAFKTFDTLWCKVVKEIYHPKAKFKTKCRESWIKIEPVNEQGGSNLTFTKTV